MSCTIPAQNEVACNKCGKIISVGDPFYTAKGTRCPSCAGPMFKNIHKLTYLQPNHPRCFNCVGPLPKFYYELTNEHSGLLACPVCAGTKPKTKKTLPNFGPNAQVISGRISTPPEKSDTNVLSAEAKFFRQSRVPEIPNGVAPCGHPGIHVFPNYVSCMHGCNK